MDPQRRRPGFTIGDNAAAAARKNHELGTAHRFDSKKAQEARAVRTRNEEERRRSTDSEKQTFCN